MSTVHQTQPTIQLLLSTNEFVGALDLISTTQEVLSQELAGVHSFRLSHDLICQRLFINSERSYERTRQFWEVNKFLPKVKQPLYCFVFRHLGSQLAEMEKVIDKMMQEDFVRYATSDLNRPLTEGANVPEEVNT